MGKQMKKRGDSVHEVSPSDFLGACIGSCLEKGSGSPAFGLDFLSFLLPPDHPAQICSQSARLLILLICEALSVELFVGVSEV